ncbi:hypothetical protein M3J09_013169 [Ascochyta lentis]
MNWDTFNPTLNLFLRCSFPCCISLHPEPTRLNSIQIWCFVLLN